MRIALAPLTVADLDGATADLLHAWVTHPRSAFWGMLDADRDDVVAEYRRILDHPHHDAWLGSVDGVPTFLCETYDPARSDLAGLQDVPELAPGDLGMHVLVAPPLGPPVSGLTTAVFRAVLRHCFADPGVRRVVVEPDERNAAIRAQNRAAGFVEVRRLPLGAPGTPGAKTAMLSVCTREAFGSAHLRPEHLDAAHRHLVAKAIAELSHELLLQPLPTGGAGYELRAPTDPTDPAAERVVHTFNARRLALDHWLVDPASIVRRVHPASGAPRETPVDARTFIVDHAPLLGVPDALLPIYLEELAATLAAASWTREHHTLTAADLADADHQEVEGAMTEGHPGFVANNGRIGFAVDDHARWAPETGGDTHLVWVGVRREESQLSLGRGVTEAELYDAELGADRRRFDAVLRGQGLDPADYRYLPVHPWQWRHHLAVTFAPEVGRRQLVLLGEGSDRYRAQQSIRTFFNLDRTDRHYVKTALAIQNMGFVRGLSPAYMAGTPAINDWVADLVESDPELKERGFGVLRELAAIGWTGDVYHALPRPSPYRRMVAALWRESPVPRLAPGESCATMAALLHRDRTGGSYAATLIDRSGLSAATWVRRYLDAYLRPVAHCLLAHDLAFMPHGENVIMVLRDHVPVRMLIKDIGEEVAVMGDLALPPEVERIRGRYPDDVKALALHTDVLDGVLRHLAAILDDAGVLPEAVFWAQARDCLAHHAHDHPELADAVARYAFDRPRFRRSCLNRLQLRDTRQMVDLGDQAGSLMFAGHLDNPLAPPGDRSEPS